MSLRDSFFSSFQYDEKVPLDNHAGLFVRKLMSDQARKHWDHIKDQNEADPGAWITKLAYYVALCVVDEKGVPVFDADNDESIQEILSRIPFDELVSLANEVMEKSGLRRDVASAKKNSPTTPS